MLAMLLAMLLQCPNCPGGKCPCPNGRCPLPTATRPARHVASAKPARPIMYGMGERPCPSCPRGFYRIK